MKAQTIDHVCVAYCNCKDRIREAATKELELKARSDKKQKQLERMHEELLNLTRQVTDVETLLKMAVKSYRNALTETSKQKKVS